MKIAGFVRIWWVLEGAGTILVGFDRILVGLGWISNRFLGFGLELDPAFGRFWVPAAIRTCRLPISDDSGEFLSWICKRIPRICRNQETWKTYQNLPKPTKIHISI